MEDLRLGDVPWADYVGDGWPMGSLYDLDGSLLDTQPIRLQTFAAPSGEVQRRDVVFGPWDTDVTPFQIQNREPNRPARWTDKRGAGLLWFAFRR